MHVNPKHLNHFVQLLEKLVCSVCLLDLTIHVHITAVVVVDARLQAVGWLGFESISKNIHPASYLFVQRVDKPLNSIKNTIKHWLRQRQVQLPFIHAIDDQICRLPVINVNRAFQQLQLPALMDARPFKLNLILLYLFPFQLLGEALRIHHRNEEHLVLVV